MMEGGRKAHQRRKNIKENEEERELKINEDTRISTCLFPRFVTCPIKGMIWPGVK